MTDLVSKDVFDVTNMFDAELCLIALQIEINQSATEKSSNHIFKGER